MAANDARRVWATSQTSTPADQASAANSVQPMPWRPWPEASPRTKVCMPWGNTASSGATAATSPAVIAPSPADRAMACHSASAARGCRQVHSALARRADRLIGSRATRADSNQGAHRESLASSASRRAAATSGRPCRRSAARPLDVTGLVERGPHRLGDDGVLVDGGPVEVGPADPLAGDHALVAQPDQHREDRGGRRLGRQLRRQVVGEDPVGMPPQGVHDRPLEGAQPRHASPD